MGQEISTNHFTQEDFESFAKVLKNETTLLKEYFTSNRFCNLHHVGGFEIEAWLVNDRFMPCPRNEEFLKAIDHPMVVMELAKFNIELNVAPIKLQSNALKAMHEDIQRTWNHCQEVAASLDMDLMMIGIHPGVTDQQLSVNNMSASTRYKALNEQILAQREGRPIVLDIRGQEQIVVSHQDVMLESATTSFQIHLQVRPHKASRAINAAMIASAPLLAISANSPYLFGHELWDETRIPLFEQSVDDGNEQCKRVSFGTDYVKHDLFECFEENIEVFPPLLPIDLESEPERFSHLRLHNGTIWRWNRPLVGFTDDERVHLRIENRVVPAGPSLIDMMANAAFFWGLVRYLTDQEEVPENNLSFDMCRDNFYRAAKHSLDTEIVWIDGKCYPVDTLIIDQLLDKAAEGLLNLEIDSADCEFYLGIIRDRAKSRQNGAIWQRRWVTTHEKNMQKLTQSYLQHQATGLPVHEWGV